MEIETLREETPITCQVPDLLAALLGVYVALERLEVEVLSALPQLLSGDPSPWFFG